MNLARAPGRTARVNCELDAYQRPTCFHARRAVVALGYAKTGAVLSALVHLSGVRGTKIGSSLEWQQQCIVGFGLSVEETTVDAASIAQAQPIGSTVHGWASRPRPERVTLRGNYCRVEPLDPTRHHRDLYAAYSEDTGGRIWTYMLAGPFKDATAYQRHVIESSASDDPLHFAVVEVACGRACGTLALMRADPENGVIEVGHVAFSSRGQRTRLSTEAQYLLMEYVFDYLGYRRYEWKCDCLNAPSRCTAHRLGFQFEGVFRQAMVYKGRNRDTAWFSIIDTDWPAVQAALKSWLSPENFDASGTQRRTLAAIRNFSVS